MATRTDNKGQVVAFAKQLIAGADKHLTGGTQVTFMGGSYTSAQIAAKLQSLVTLRSDVNAAQATAKAKLALETADIHRGGTEQPDGPRDERGYAGRLDAAHRVGSTVRETDREGGGSLEREALPRPTRFGL